MSLVLGHYQALADDTLKQLTRGYTACTLVNLDNNEPDQTYFLAVEKENKIQNLPHANLQF
ncbi:MAG: hypothetical protein ACRCV6_10380 [Formosimonas sp.]